jgi:hypothetical protein
MKVMKDVDIGHNPRYSFDRSFRFSKLKDPSNTKDREWWKKEQETNPGRIDDPAFRFSELKDSTQRGDEEEWE